MTSSAFSYKVTVTSGSTGATKVHLLKSKAEVTAVQNRASDRDTVEVKDLNREPKSDD